MAITNTSTIWHALKGIICVYKPAEDSVKRLRIELISKLVKELNVIDKELKFPSQLLLTASEKSTGLITPIKNLTLNHSKDITLHPAIIGPKYSEEAVTVSWSNYLGWNTSGVLLFGLRSGTQLAKYIRENRPTRAYRITGMLGQATENGFKGSKVVERSTWKFIRQENMDKLLQAMQAAHQKQMFQMLGVDMQSQEAYELAVQGPLRPVDSKIPIIYGLKCIEFNPPEFTIEVQCVNEYETYLSMLIHDIGIKLHSTAHTISIKCIRHSCFTLEHALLPKHFTLENIVANLALCGKLLGQHEHLLEQDSITLRQ